MGDPDDILLLLHRPVYAIEDVEPHDRVRRIENHHLALQSVAAVIDNHRRNLRGRIETNDRAGVAQRRRHDIAGRLVPSRAGEEEHVCRTEVLRIGQERRFSTAPPCRGIVRIERHRVHEVLVDAITLPDDDLTILRKEPCGLTHRQPVGITEGSAAGTPDRFRHDTGDAR